MITRVLDSPCDCQMGMIMHGIPEERDMFIVTHISDAALMEVLSWYDVIHVEVLIQSLLFFKEVQ